MAANNIYRNFSCVVWSVISATLFVSCGSKGTEATEPVQHWEYGQSVTYTLSGSHPVQDTLLNVSIEGESGLTIAIKEVNDGPQPPLASKTFEITSEKNIVVGSEVIPEGRIFLYAYGPFNTLDDSAVRNIWWPLPIQDTVNGEVRFELPIEKVSAFSKVGKNGSIHARPRLRSAWNGIKQYALVRLSPGMASLTKLQSFEREVDSAIKNWIDTLPASLQSAARTASAGRLKPVVSISSENAYQGLWTVLGTVFPRCLISLTDNASQGNIAHEVGHYMNHVLVGDDRYEELHDLAPPAYHAPAVLFDGRTTITEEYAYFSEFFLYGSIGGSLDPALTRQFLNNTEPATADLPSIEGFGQILLYGLTRTTTQMQDPWKLTLQRPVIGLSFSDVMMILSHGARNMNELRDDIENFVRAKGGSAWKKVPAIFEGCGWSYHIKAKVVDAKGKAVPGIEVNSIYMVDGVMYKGLYGGNSGADGSVKVTRVFPDTSILRLYKKGVGGQMDSIDTVIYIDWKNPTQTEIDVGNLVWRKDSLTLKTVVPAKAVPGKQVKLSGAGFGTTQGTGRVEFNSSAAQIIIWTDTAIVVTVPEAGSTGTVAVVTATGRSNTQPFSYGPWITRLSPSTFHPAKDTVHIYGKGFGKYTSYLRAEFNGVLAANISVTADTDFVVVPATETRSGNLVVDIMFGDTSNVFAYSIKAPEIKSISPTQGEPYTVITLKGKGFGMGFENDLSLMLGNINLKGKTNSWSDTAITFYFPQGFTGGNVTVGKGDVVSNAVQLGAWKPTISISPHNADVMWGDSLRFQIVSGQTESPISTSLLSRSTGSIRDTVVYYAPTYGISVDTLVAKLGRYDSIRDTAIIRVRPKWKSKQKVSFSVSNISFAMSTDGGAPVLTQEVIYSSNWGIASQLAAGAAGSYTLKVDTSSNSYTYSGDVSATINAVDSPQVSLTTTLSQTFQSGTISSVQTLSMQLNNVKTYSLSSTGSTWEVRGQAACAIIKSFSLTKNYNTNGKTSLYQYNGPPTCTDLSVVSVRVYD